MVRSYKYVIVVNRSVKRKIIKAKIIVNNQFFLVGFSFFLLYSTTAIVQGQLKLYKQLKVLKRTLKTAKKWKYGTKQCIYKENRESLYFWMMWDHFYLLYNFRCSCTMAVVQCMCWPKWPLSCHHQLSFCCQDTTCFPYLLSVLHLVHYH